MQVVSRRLSRKGNIYLTGYTMSSGLGDYLTIKYRPNGDLAWTQTYDGVASQYDFSNWVAIDDEENVYITGYSRGISYQFDIATVKYDSSGNQLWVARFDGPSNDDDEGHKVIAPNDGYVYVTGFVNPSTLRDYIIIKYHAATGDTAWARTFNGVADSLDEARDIEVDASGNVYVTGSSRGSGTSTDIVTIKYDSLGNEKWVARYNNPDTSGVDGGYGIEVDNGSNVYVTGQSRGLGTSTDFVTIKYDSLGNELWTTRYNGPASGLDRPSDETGGKCMAIDQYANIYVGGVSRGVTSLNDYIAIMYDSAGVEQWVAGYNYCDSVDNALALAIDYSGGVYITGRSVGIGTYGDWATVKYWSAVGIVEGQTSSTKRLLLEIHPNPAKTHSFIHYALPDDGRVSLSIYDVSGRLVKNMVDQHQKSGVYAVVWNGRDSNNNRVAPGVYFYVLRVDGLKTQKKIVMVK